MLIHGHGLKTSTWAKADMSRVTADGVFREHWRENENGGTRNGKMREFKDEHF
jgi:hypothetical protein